MSKCKGQRVPGVVEIRKETHMAVAQWAQGGRWEGGQKSNCWECLRMEVISYGATVRLVGKIMAFTVKDMGITAGGMRPPPPHTCTVT